MVDHQLLVAQVAQAVVVQVQVVMEAEQLEQPTQAVVVVEQFPTVAEVVMMEPMVDQEL